MLAYGTKLIDIKAVKMTAPATIIRTKVVEGNNTNLIKAEHYINTTFSYTF